MSDPYTQAAMISQPWARAFSGIFDGQRMRAEGELKAGIANAQREQALAHANLFDQQSAKVKAESDALAQRRQYQTPEFSNKIAAALTGLSDEQGQQLSGFQSRGNWGESRGAELPEGQEGPPMPVQNAQPAWFNPQLQQRFNQARGAHLANLGATGNTNAEQMTDAYTKLLGQNRIDSAMLDPKLAEMLGRAMAASQGKALFHQGANGVMDQFSGKETINDVGRSAILENKAQANNANASAGNQAASAALHRAQIPEVQSRIDLNKSKIGKGETITMPDGTVVQTGTMPKLTEIQAKSQLFGSRAAEADRTIRELEGKYSPAAVNAKLGAESVWGVGGALGAAGNYMLSKEGQKAEQAQRDFINAVLRQESGAAIAESEFDNARKQYFPQPGDTKEVLKQKENTRRLAIEGLKVMAGPASGLVNYGGQKPKNVDRVQALYEAKAAIEAGASRELVIKRLKEMGINDGGF